MRVTAESTANSGTPKVKNVCFIITYGQCDISHLSRAEFADIIVDAWAGRSTTSRWECRRLMERAVVTSTRQKKIVHKIEVASYRKAREE
jgi:hypothetical protein